MSAITVNNARVTKHVGETAFQVQETYNGDWTRNWTVWNKAEGARPELETYVSVSGEYGSKIRSYEASNGDVKHAVDLSINNPVWVADSTAGMTDAQIASLQDPELDAPF